MRRIKLFFTLFLIFAAFMVSGQSILKENHKSFRMGLALQGSIPTGNFAEFYSMGIGGALLFEGQLTNFFSVTAELGYSSYTGKEVEMPEGLVTMENMIVPSVLVGAKFQSGIFYGDIRAGYFMGDMEEIGLVPSIGVQYKNWDFNLGMKALNQYYYGFLRIGYYFLNTRKTDPFCESL